MPRALSALPRSEPDVSPRTRTEAPRHLTLLPDIAPTRIIRLAILAVEVLDGRRDLSQLRGLVTPAVFDEIRQRRLLRADLRTMTRDTRINVPTPHGCRLSRPSIFAVEAAVVLRQAERYLAVAIRLDYESDRSRWRATCLSVL